MHKIKKHEHAPNQHKIDQHRTNELRKAEETEFRQIYWRRGNVEEIINHFRNTEKDNNTHLGDVIKFARGLKKYTEGQRDMYFDLKYVEQNGLKRYFDLIADSGKIEALTRKDVMEFMKKLDDNDDLRTYLGVMKNTERVETVTNKKFIEFAEKLDKNVMSNYLKELEVGENFFLITSEKFMTVKTAEFMNKIGYKISRHYLAASNQDEKLGLFAEDGVIKSILSFGSEYSIGRFFDHAKMMNVEEIKRFLDICGVVKGSVLVRENFNIIKTIVNCPPRITSVIRDIKSLDAVIIYTIFLRIKFG